MISGVFLVVGDKMVQFILAYLILLEPLLSKRESSSRLGRICSSLFLLPLKTCQLHFEFLNLISQMVFLDYDFAESYLILLLAPKDSERSLQPSPALSPCSFTI